MRIGPKIYLIVAIMVVASIVAYGIARSGMEDIRATYNTAFKERAPVTRIIDDFRSTSLDMKLQVWTLLVPDNSKTFIEQQITDMDTLKQHCRDLIADWDKNAVKGASPAEEAKFKELAAATTPWFAAIDEYDGHMMGWLKTGSEAERKVAFKSNDSGPVDSTQKNIETLVGDLQKITDAENKKVQAEAEREQAAALTRLAGVVGGTIVVALVLAVLIASSIVRPMRATVSFAEDVAKGKLDARAPRAGGGETGELAEAIERMKESLVNRVDTMREVAAMVEIAAEAVSSTASDVSAAASRSGEEQLAASAEKLVRQTVNLRGALAGFGGESPAQAESESDAA